MDTDRPIWRSRAWTAVAAAVGVVTLVFATVGVEGPGSVAVAWTLAITVVGGAALSASLRLRDERRRYEDELAGWAAERAAQAERLRIARDLHDLASHGLGLITLRAAAARSVPGEAGALERERALADIEQASRRTTDELRRMLTVLRSPGPAPLRPADTLADLPEVVEAAAAGVTAPTLEVDLDRLGDVAPLAQLTVCAVVREALQNTVRHAGPTAVCVVVRREADDLVADVHDAGPEVGWEPRPGAGHGLAGLRERVAAAGGSLTAGPHGDGWAVCARVPAGGAA